MPIKLKNIIVPIESRHIKKSIQMNAHLTNCGFLGKVLVMSTFLFPLFAASRIPSNHDGNISASEVVETGIPSVSYNILDSKYVSSSEVKISLVIYHVKKKDMARMAQYVTLRTVLFDGIGNGIFAHALLPDGEQTSYQQHAGYLDNLYYMRINDFIGECSMVSEYKKGDNEGGTMFRVVVKAMRLRQDLKKNKIKNKMGL